MSALLIAAGAFAIKSLPSLDLGKAITSLMFLALHNIAINLSNPVMGNQIYYYIVVVIL